MLRHCRLGDSNNIWLVKPCIINLTGSFLSTHADRQGVNISFTVCVFVFCTVTDFSAEDNASGVKFCTTVHRHPRQKNSHSCELCSPRYPKSDESASAPPPPRRSQWLPFGSQTHERGHVDVGSACVDIRPPRRRMYLSQTWPKL